MKLLRKRRSNFFYIEHIDYMDGITSAVTYNMDLIIQEDYFGEGAFVPYQKALWDLFEKPQGGTAAKVKQN